MNYIPVFKMSLAAYLMVKGIPLSAVSINKKTGNFVFLFQNTEITKKYIDMFKEDKQFQNHIERQQFSQ